VLHFYNVWSRVCAARWSKVSHAELLEGKWWGGESRSERLPLQNIEVFVLLTHAASSYERALYLERVVYWTPWRPVAGVSIHLSEHNKITYCVCVCVCVVVVAAQTRGMQSWVINFHDLQVPVCLNFVAPHANVLQLSLVCVCVCASLVPWHHAYMMRKVFCVCVHRDFRSLCVCLAK